LSNPTKKTERTKEEITQRKSKRKETQQNRSSQREEQPERKKTKRGTKKALSSQHTIALNFAFSSNSQVKSFFFPRI
jgi:hypothetical protein